MATNGNDDGGAPPVSAKDDEEEYRAGYLRTMREMEFVQSSYGWRPSERQLVLALTRTVRIYTATKQGKKPNGGRHPNGCAVAPTPSGELACAVRQEPHRARCRRLLQSVCGRLFHVIEDVTGHFHIQRARLTSAALLAHFAGHAW